jgi:hypothetical protein
MHFKVSYALIRLHREDESSYSEEGKISNSTHDKSSYTKRSTFSTYVSTDPNIRSPRGIVIQRGESGSDFSDWERFVMYVYGHMCKHVF